MRKATVVAAILSGCAAPAAPEAGSPTAPTAPTARTAAPSEAAALPAGWRWETWRDVQVGVPDTFGWTGTGRMNQWCVGGPAQVDDPAVGRPGVQTLVGCGEGQPGGPPRETLVRHTGPTVAFDFPYQGRDSLSGIGDRVEIKEGHALVIIQVEPPALREQIAATVHQVRRDQNGCPTHHPLSEEPAWRPTGQGLDEASGVTSLVACTYTIAHGEPLHGPGLWSSIRLDGGAAREVVRAAAAAPPGSGPNSPESCSDDYAYGDEVMLVSVEDEGDGFEFVVRYSGCDHNGIDDGVRSRQLSEAVAPLMVAPNRPSSWSGPESKTDLMFPEGYAAADGR